MTKNWIKIGIVGKPYGLRGAFYVSGRSEILQSDFSEVSLGSDATSGLKSEVKEQKTHKGRSILILTELNDRTAMERYLGKAIWAQSAEVDAEFDEEFEYRWKDLIGKKIVDSQDQLIGVVTHVSNHGATDIVELENKKGDSLDIAFIPAYFDMNFTSKDSKLHLVVPKENFDDLWQESAESGKNPI